MIARGAAALRGLRMNPVAFKDLLVFARAPGGPTGLRALGIALALSLPLLAFAACVVSFPGPWRFAGRPVLLLVAGLMALFNVSVAVPAATAFALERDRETIESLVVSPLSPWRLVTGKLLAALAVGVFAKAAVLPALCLAWALGGADLGFVPAFLVLLLATDASFASFALLVGARRLEAPARVGWLRTQTSQAQLALQSSVGLSVLASLAPVYAGLFLIPVALQRGVVVSSLLDTLAPLGVLHPLAALLVWGPAEVFGVTVPVWLLAAVFHLLLALPLLADAAEAQRSEGRPPGRAPRLLALLPAAFVLLLVAQVARSLGPAPRAGLAVLGPALLVFAAVARTAFVRHPPRTRVSVARVLGGLAPHRALESAPDRAPGYALLLALLGAPLLLWGGGGGASAFAAAAALALAGVGLATVGARLVAGAQRREDLAFREAPGRATAEDAPTDDGPGDADETERSRRGRHLVRLAVVCLLLPAAAAAGITLGQGVLPGLASLRPLFAAAGTLGLALNPFAATLPVLADARVVGTDAPLRLLASMGVEPWVAFSLHLALYGAALLAALATLPTPLDLGAVLARAVADRKDASPAETGGDTGSGGADGAPEAAERGDPADVGSPPREGGGATRPSPAEARPGTTDEAE